MNPIRIPLTKMSICELGYKVRGKSAASFCHQVAAWFLDKFCNFYLVENCKIAKNSTTTKARDKNKHVYGILRILEVF